MKLNGKTALITGGSGGLGSAIAKTFATAGAQVIITYNKNKTKALALVKKLKQSGKRAAAFQLDLSDTAMIDGFTENIWQRFKRIDILVNNAAIVADNPALAMTDDEWDTVLATNLSGAFRLCRAVGKYMSLRKSGRIINISSVVAGLGGRGQINYLASKGGLESLTRGLAIEMARNNVLVNAVAPGVMDTPMSKGVLGRFPDRVLGKILLNRPAKLEEVASVALFLASDRASYITGQVIRVDGGFGLNF